LDLYNQAGELVKDITDRTPVQSGIDDFTITNSTFSPQAGQQAVILVDGKAYMWNGANDNGQQVDSGIYYVKVATWNSSGVETDFIHAVTVIALGNQFTLKVFNSAGELVRNLWVATYNGLPPSELTVVGPSALAFGPAGNQFTFNIGPATKTWDGLNDQGQRVASGVYTVQLGYEASGSAVNVAALNVTVINAGGSVLAGAFVAPNPVQPGQDLVTVVCPNAPAGSQIVGRLYDVAGELVLTASSGAQPGKLTFNFGGRQVAGGTYIVALYGQAPWGQGERRTVRFVVIR
jgi:hypothetical protein